MRKGTLVRDDYPLAQTAQGIVRGVEIDGVINFRGVDYAWSERFEAPQPPKSWEGIRDCFVWGDTCLYVDPPKTTLFSSHRYWMMSEHCQNVNIWTKDLNGKKPVMVWLHGGGYFSGSAIDEEITEGDGLAATGEVVVVSVNHRFGVIGFLNLSEYGEAFQSAANAGMDDIVAALKWVRENIAAFGGDPDNVTIFGQSGGGGKVMTLMRMPEADGLYHKAIIQSGVGGPGEKHRQPASREFARRTVAHLGLDEQTIDQIRTIPFMQLHEAAEAAGREMGGLARDFWGPHPDDKKVLENHDVIGFRKEALDVPVLVGTCIAEGALFSPEGLKKPLFSLDDIENLSSDEKKNRLRAKFGDRTDAVYNAIQNTYPQLDPLFALNLDSGTRRTALKYARARSDAGCSVYNYLFTYKVPVMEGKLAWHGADLGFTFGTLDKSDTLCSGGEPAYRLMEKMRDAWVNFAKYGDPNHLALPAWGTFTADAPNTMLFDTECTVKQDHDKALLEALGTGRF